MFLKNNLYIGLGQDRDPFIMTSKNIRLEAGVKDP